MFLNKLKRNEFWLVLMIVIALLLVFFVKLVDNYRDHEGLIMIDIPVNNFIVHLRNPTLNRVMMLITLTGNWQMLYWGSLLGGLLLIRAKKWRYLLALIISDIGGVLFTEGAKFIFSRPRPPISNALIQASGYAFPSGHSYFAVVFYGLLAYFWFRHFKSKRIRTVIVIMGSLFVLLLAFSRIYLGVHWMTDVLAGLSSSGVWLAVTIMYIEYRIRFFVPEYRKIDRKKIWEDFWIFSILWLLGLGYLYLTTSVF